MKKIYPLILILLFLFLFSFPVRAIGSEATQGAGTGIRQTIREEVQEKIATVQARLTERKKEIIYNHFTRVTRRLEAAINRLSRLISRIESRLIKIEQEDENINTTLIKKDIASAKEKLDQAAIQLENIKTKMNEVIESETPRDGFVEVKEMVGEIRESLVGVHQILVKIIGDIKGLRVGE